MTVRYWDLYRCGAGGFKVLLVPITWAAICCMRMPWSVRPETDTVVGCKEIYDYTFLTYLNMVNYSKPFCFDNVFFFCCYDEGKNDKCKHQWCLTHVEIPFKNYHRLYKLLSTLELGFMFPRNWLRASY